MKKNDDAVLENRIVWSANRVSTLGRCPRRYYHAYIGSWLGWDLSSSPASQCAYRVKHLTTAQLEIGNIVHAQIRGILLKAWGERPIVPATEIKVAQAQFRDFVEHSFERRLEELTAKRRKLFLHEMGESISPEEMAKHEGSIAQFLESFLGFADVQCLLNDPKSIIWELSDPPGFDLGDELGVPARPKTDAVFRDPSGLLVIADWKCGAPSDDHRRQGLVYALFISRKMQLPSTEPLEVRFYYLPTGTMEAFRYSAQELDDMLWQIGEDFGSLQAVSEDPVINVGEEERFKPLVSPRCFGCNFRLMCEPFLRSPLGRKKGDK